MTELTSQSLFQSGEFQQQPDRELFARHGIKCFPNQIWWSPASKIAVGCCYRSQTGTDYSLGVPMLQLLTRLENEGERVKQAYIVTCKRDGGRPELQFCCTLEQQEQKLGNAEPKSRQMGAYYWIDEKGDPTILSKRQASDEWI